MKKIKIIASLCPPVGACPAVYETDGQFLVVGQLVEAQSFAGLEARVAADEAVVLVPKELIKKIKEGKFDGIFD